jgi:hypothetical protein
MTPFAASDALLGFANGRRVNCYQLNAWSREQLPRIEAAL